MPHAPPSPPGAASFPPADLDRRFTAFALDRVLGWSVAAGVGFLVWRFVGDDDVLAGLGAAIGVLLLLGVVNAVLLATTASTPGKAAVGLRVVRAGTGRPLGLGAALARTAVLGLAGWPTAGLGLATLAWTAAVDPTRRGQALHDRIGDALVVDVRPQPVVDDREPSRPQQVVNLTALRLLPGPSPEEVAATPAAPEQAPLPAAPPPAAPTPAPPPAPVSAPSPLRPSGPPPALPPALPSDQTRVRPAVAAGPVVRWRVAFDSGEVLDVDGLALVGRRPEPRPEEPVRHVIPLRSSDMSVSKTHAQFQVAPDGALVVMDRGSTNGTYVVRGGHSRALPPGRPSTLLDGDLVRFGDRSMQVTRLG